MRHVIGYPLSGVLEAAPAFKPQPFRDLMSKTKQLVDMVPPEIERKVAGAQKNELIGSTYPYRKTLKRAEYEREKKQLQIELLKMQ